MSALIKIMSKTTLAFVLAVFLGSTIARAAEKEISTFPAYVDSDLCARLMLGPITSKRVACSQQTHKEGSQPVLVRLSNDMVLDVNKQKMIEKFVGQLVEVSGELKVKDGEVKLQTVKPIEAGSIPAGDPSRKLLDVRTYRAPGSPKMYEKIRHELAMMPYISEFDFISFAMVGDNVILSGWTVRLTNRSDAENIVKNIEGVNAVVNNIEALPLGSFDMRIRALARAALQTNLSRYFWGSGSDIKIIVKNGDVILLGAVTNSGDKDIANVRINQLPGVFHVFNLLRVAGSEQKG
jgi:hyperosmotically inducible protein